MQIKTSQQTWLRILLINRAIASIQNEMLKKSNQDKIEVYRNMIQYWTTEKQNLLINIQEYNTAKSELYQLVGGGDGRSSTPNSSPARKDWNIK